MAAARYPISNNLVFAKVMNDNRDLCVRVVERVLGFGVRDVEYVHVEHALPSISRRSVQLDVVLRASGKVVNLEMQTYDRGDLGRRMRLHRSLMDATQVGKGAGFGDVCDNYVVFICTFDPFGEGLARYTFRTACAEGAGLVLDDGATGLVYNAAGDLSSLDGETARLLQYVLTDDDGGDDGLVRDLARAVEAACASEELQMGIHTWEQEMADRYEYGRRIGREEGKRDGVAEGEARGEARAGALVAAMAEAGVPAGDIVAALASADMRALCEQYGVQLA